MADFVGIEVIGLKELAARLDKLPEAAQDMGVEEANKKIVYVERMYAQYKYISVKQSGGWKSEKQRRYVMAMLRSGEMKIPYRRTQKLSRGWRTYGAGKTQIVANEVQYAQYVKDLPTQTQGHMLRGWDVIQTDLETHLKGILAAFEGGVKKAIKKLGL